jgi:hypothetical protein
MGRWNRGREGIEDSGARNKHEEEDRKARKKERKGVRQEHAGYS